MSFSVRRPSYSEPGKLDLVYTNEGHDESNEHDRLWGSPGHAYVITAEEARNLADDLAIAVGHRVEVRAACRRRLPLPSATAQALEHALTITEGERDRGRAALARVAALVGQWHCSTFADECADELASALKGPK